MTATEFSKLEKRASVPEVGRGLQHKLLPRILVLLGYSAAYYSTILYMWCLATTRRNTFLISALKAVSIVSAMTTTTSSSFHKPMTTNNPSYNNVLISSAYLMPVSGKMITAHQTRSKMMELLEETMDRRKDDERAMIVDISATTWNWDTYAIVAGTPQPVQLVFSNRDQLMEYLPLDETGTAQRGVLVPQFDDSKDEDKVCESDKRAKAPAMVWVPKGAVLKQVETRADGMNEFVFETPVDPNDDRLEHWEQEVLGNQWIYKWRAQLASESMRNMLRFYNLDRIVCWDLSWGIWEAVRETAQDENDNDDENGCPTMFLVKNGKEKIPVPSLDRTDENVDVKDMDLFYEYARPISTNLLAESLQSVSGYYLVGGNTYTMSLFHHMWDRQHQNEGGIGHMQLLRKQLANGTLFYSGHSAGAIMSGPNILTATFKGIDAFAAVTQPYNAPYLRLPPLETQETFFAPEKNNLWKARTQMLQKMDEYGAWRGYHVVEALTFPHYDSRPRRASFPHSAETYLRATDDQGRFCQTKGSLLVGKTKENRAEPVEVQNIRQETNAKQLPCYPIANGHSILMACGGLKVVQALSPEEEGGGTLHWDTYMPYVPDKDYLQFASGRSQFTVGSFTDDANTMAGDRSTTSEYNGARIFSRLNALGLPCTEEAESLFRSE